MIVQSAQSALMAASKSGRSNVSYRVVLDSGSSRAIFLPPPPPPPVSLPPPDEPPPPQAARVEMPRPVARAIPARRVNRVVMLSSLSVCAGIPVGAAFAEFRAVESWRQDLNSRNLPNCDHQALCRGLPGLADSERTHDVGVGIELRPAQCH